jgi:hypothetical protein
MTISLEMNIAMYRIPMAFLMHYTFSASFRPRISCEINKFLRYMTSTSRCTYYGLDHCFAKIFIGQLEASMRDEALRTS